jgi:hypothetical protein
MSAPTVIYTFEHISPSGEMLFRTSCPNILTNEGKTSLVKFITGDITTPSKVYVVLNKNSSSPSASMVYASQGAGSGLWNEIVTEINQTSRVEWQHGSISSNSVNNSSNKAIFTFKSNTTVFGFGLVFSPTQASGITTLGDVSASDGILYSMTALSSSRAVGNKDTVRITATVSQS